MITAASTLPARVKPIRTITGLRPKQTAHATARILPSMSADQRVKAVVCGSIPSRILSANEDGERMTDAPRRVALIATGGTIDSVGVDRLDLAWYIEADKRLGPGELLAQIPELAKIAQIQEVPFRRLKSHGLVVKDWLDLVRLIHDTLEGGRADGLVITHGTNTLEESPKSLYLRFKKDRTLEVVGSMLQASRL